MKREWRIGDIAISVAMGIRNRERIRRIVRGQESSIREQKRLEALEKVAEQFPGQGAELAEVIRALSEEGKLK